MTIAKAFRGPLARSIAVTFGAKIVGAMLALVTSVIIARTLGPEGRGAFAAVSALAGIGSQFANLGLQASNSYYLARDRSLLPTVAANSAAVSLVAGLTAASVLAVYALWSGMAADVGSGLLTVALLGIPVSLAYMLFVGLLIPMSKVGQFNRVEIAIKILTLILILGVSLLDSAPTALQFLFAGLVAQIVMVVAAWRSINLPVGTLSKLSLPQLLEHLPFAFRAHLASFFAFLLVRIDMLMVQQISGNAEAGYYSIAVSMADLLYMFPATVGALLFPRLSAVNDESSRLRATLKALLGTAVAMSLMAIAAVFLAAPLIGLMFGERFLPAAPMFHVLALAIVAYGLNNVLSNHMASIGLPWKGVWLWLVGVVVNIVLNLYWIPAYGGWGAAMASLVAYVLVLIVQTGVVFGVRGVVR